MVVTNISWSDYSLQEVQFWDGYTTFSLIDSIDQSAQVRINVTTIQALCPPG